MTTQGADAWFPLAALPPGPFKVIVIAGEKEWRFEVKADKRGRIR